MSGQDAEVPQQVQARRWHCGAKPNQQVVGLEHDGAGAVFPDTLRERREHRLRGDRASPTGSTRALRGQVLGLGYCALSWGVLGCTEAPMGPDGVASNDGAKAAASGKLELGVGRAALGASGLASSTLALARDLSPVRVEAHFTPTVLDSRCYRRHGHLREGVACELEASLCRARNLGVPLAAHGVTADHFTNQGNAYRFGVAPFKVEVLTKISGVSFDEALQGSKTFELDGHQIPYIGKLALIRNKKSAARHKDLADVEELERSNDSE